MARVAHATSRTRNRCHIPLTNQSRTLDKKPPLKFRFPECIELDPPLLPQAIRCSVYISDRPLVTADIKENAGAHRRRHLSTISIIRVVVSSAIRPRTSHFATLGQTGCPY